MEQTLIDLKETIAAILVKTDLIEDEEELTDDKFERILSGLDERGYKFIDTINRITF